MAERERGIERGGREAGQADKAQKAAKWISQIQIQMANWQMNLQSILRFHCVSLSLFRSHTTPLPPSLCLSFSSCLGNSAFSHSPHFHAPLLWSVNKKKKKEKREKREEKRKKRQGIQSREKWGTIRQGFWCWFCKDAPARGTWGRGALLCCSTAAQVAAPLSLPSSYTHKMNNKLQIVVDGRL